MTENVENMTLELLRSIRGDVHEMKAAQYFGEFARPEVGEYKPPSIKRKVISAELPKRTVDAMSRMCGVRRGPLG